MELSSLRQWMHILGHDNNRRSLKDLILLVRESVAQWYVPLLKVEAMSNLDYQTLSWTTLHRDFSLQTNTDFPVTIFTLLRNRIVTLDQINILSAISNAIHNRHNCMYLLEMLNCKVEIKQGLVEQMRKSLSHDMDRAHVYLLPMQCSELYIMTGGNTRLNSDDAHSYLVQIASYSQYLSSLITKAEQAMYNINPNESNLPLIA